jgi:hypothetical protein
VARLDIADRRASPVRSCRDESQLEADDATYLLAIHVHAVALSKRRPRFIFDRRVGL